MKNAHRISAVLLVLAAFTTAAMADGMIVPVRPDIRVRGHWAVKYHHVRITVRDQVASVSIDQEFVNTGRGMIEVEYLFPVPPGAAIDSMTLVVDGKEFAAKLLKADEARKIYEDIVRRKKDPALLEYAGFGLYRTKAFPLLPGKPCKVIVTYKSVCKKDHDLVELWYPLNTEKFSARPIEDVEVKADLKSKADITAVYSPTHDITVRRKSPRHVIATYHAKNVLPTTDFQVFYKAANEAVGATLLTHQPEAGKDGYFMLLVSPNPRSAATAVAAKDVVIVLDRSGSMSGEKIDQAKGALGFIMRNLNKADRFEIIAYNDSVESLFDVLVPADEKHVAQATSRLDRIDAGGGTNIHEALQVAMNRVASKQADGRPKYVIFLTDGLPTVGKTDEKTILADTKKANVNRARLFAFGVGYDVNVRLLDKLVAENKGRSDYVKPKENVEAKVSSLYTKIKDPVMTGLKVRIEGLRLRDTYPRELGDLFAGDQIVMVGRYHSAIIVGYPVRFTEPYNTTLVLTGTYEGKSRSFEYHVTVAPAGKRGGCTFVEKLWAVRRVGWLLDQIQLHGKSKEMLDELVRLSMAHGIMTPYTSFLADETTRLSDSLELHRQAEIAARPLSKVSGDAGQVAAKNRQKLNYAYRVPAARGVYTESKLVGHADKRSYEAGEAQTVANVRQVGNQALYRRGRVWVAANAAKLDLEKDAGKIRTIERFGEEYFRLIRANTVAENQLLASQQADEELLIRLRGQVYRIR